MQFHSLKRTSPNKKSAQVGRGGKRGKTSGRGTKGQKARAGHKIYPEIRDVIKRIPKLRGRGKNIFQSIQSPYMIVHVGQLEKSFESGDIVSPSTLVVKGLLPTYKGLNPKVKILSDGEISKKLTIKQCRISVIARAKIEKAGGTVPKPVIK